MYGHNGRHFRLVALLKRPAGRLADLHIAKDQKSRFKAPGRIEAPGLDPLARVPESGFSRIRTHVSLNDSQKNFLC
jgi:hypothetical protein